MSSTRLIAVVIATLAAALMGTGSGAAAAAIKLVPVLTSGLSAPVLVTNARDGSNRLFIVQQGGVIYVRQPGQAFPTVFLDITSQVRWSGEQGLLGLTFHPQYASNRRFFVNYNRQPDGPRGRE